MGAYLDVLRRSRKGLAPRADALTVTVAGNACTSGWDLDPVTHTVTFVSAGPCAPQRGDDIVIDYSAACHGE